MTLYPAGGHGDDHTIYVISVKDDHLSLSGNHPALAQTLYPVSPTAFYEISGDEIEFPGVTAGQASVDHLNIQRRPAKKRTLDSCGTAVLQCRNKFPKTVQRRGPCSGK
jgi:hypothetical protein